MALWEGKRRRNLCSFTILTLLFPLVIASIAGTRFRQWATKVLRAILLEGVKRDYRLEALESREALNENGLQRVEEGLNYLVEQMSAPTMKRVTGFSKEGRE